VAPVVSPRLVAAVVVLRDDGAALLQHRDEKPGLSHAGMWVIPGGHCEPVETVERCARRELLEETGYDCEAPRFLMSVARNDVDEHLVVYWTRYDGVQPVHCGEGQAVEFVDYARRSAYAIPPILVDAWERALAAASH